MAYSTNDDVRLHAPQAPDGQDFAGYTSQADGIIDAHLQGIFDLPLSSPVPQIIVNISSMLSAAMFLKSQYSRLKGDIPKSVMDLGSHAMAQLMGVVSSPKQLGIDLKTTTSDDEERDNVLVSDKCAGVFSMGDETTWG